MLEKRTLQHNKIRCVIDLEAEYWDVLDRYFAKGPKGRLSGQEGLQLLADRPKSESMTQWLRQKSKQKLNEIEIAEEKKKADEAAKTPEERKREKFEAIAERYASNSLSQLSERQITATLQELFGDDLNEKKRFIEQCNVAYDEQQRRVWAERCQSLDEDMNRPATPEFIATEIAKIKQILAI